MKIPEDSLGTAYREIMDVVRRLGNRYVWIDSLCIVQDSREDWRNECSRMGDVYRHGDCNLWKDVDANFFSWRDPRKLEQLVVRAVSEEDKCNGGQWVVSNISPIEETMLADTGAGTPLYKHGWVIQEWYMARRILYFGERIITLECCEGSASEAFPLFQPQREVIPLRIKSLLSAHELRTEEICMKAWYNIVETYTCSELTVPGDKLPTISAVAKELGWHLQRAAKEGEVVEYVAGLWSTWCWHQLLWRPCGFGDKSPCSNYRAPSWSWASMDVEVSMSRADGKLAKKPLVEILDQKTFPLGNDCFQELVGGYVKLRGWLWKINQSEFNRGGEFHILLDAAPEWFQKQPDNGNQCLQREKWLLPLILRSYYKPGMGVEGLVLDRDSATDYHFKRAGTFGVDLPVDGIVPVHVLEGDDERTIDQRIDALDLNDILEPTLRRVEKVLDKHGFHGFDEDIPPSAYEERIEDQRFLGNDAPRAAKWLYTVTLI